MQNKYLETIVALFFIISLCFVIIIINNPIKNNNKECKTLYTFYTFNNNKFETNKIIECNGIVNNIKLSSYENLNGLINENTTSN